MRAALSREKKEVSKRRADVFFRLNQGECIAFADGKDKRIKFQLQQIQKVMPKKTIESSQEDMQMNYKRIYREVKTVFRENDHK